MTYRSLALLLLATGLSGCFTMSGILDEQVPVQPSKAERDAFLNTPVLTDQIFAVGELDADGARQLGLASNIRGVVFFGESFSYVIYEGGDELIRVARELDGALVRIENPPRSLFLEEHVARGTVTLGYGQKGRPPSAAERDKLAALGFVASGDGVFQKKINVGATMRPAVPPSARPPGLKVTRRLDFYGTKPPPKGTRSSTPAKVIALDVVTLPAQLVFGVAVVGVAIVNDP